MLEPLVREYLTKIQAQKAAPSATGELSYRDFLGAMLREAAKALGREATFTGEAKAGIFGRPDYEASRGLRVIGYVEAEALGVNLDKLTGSAKTQNERFKNNLHNFLLTNHTDFLLFVDGKEAARASLPAISDAKIGTIAASRLEELSGLLERFLDEAAPAATSAEAIARQLARRARFLRAAAEEMLTRDDSPLRPLYEMYRQTMFDSLTDEKFADLYAQTFTYGLFLTWLNDKSPAFTRESALRSLPRAVPPVRVFLQFSGGYELPAEFEWIVGGICEDLDSADKTAAMQPKQGIADPLIHFYETFLAAYDPALRERAGVYYTPDAVVDFIVRAVDDTLKAEFGKAEGVADTDVRILDPATGTATFPARVYRKAHETMMANGEAGLWPDRARNHLAKHVYGFERLPAAYTLAHIHLRQLLTELGASLPDDLRLPIYLADTLMNRVPEALTLPGANVLSAESIEAKRVRDAEPLLVVMGNPPYFGKSDNPSRDASGKETFIGELISAYYKMDGAPLGEKNPKWLQNDYVKFLRFAQWRIERTGAGIVAFITDNSYLDNPTFRGMRRSLMRSFDAIHLLDLHGNSKKKERSPDGSKDENVFDITQGVAIALFVRRPGEAGATREATIYHADVYGSRKAKYDYLRSHSLQSVAWNQLKPNAPFYLFMPQEQVLKEEYEQGWGLPEIFPTYALGANSHRDGFAIAFGKDELLTRISSFIATPTDAECYSKFELSDNRDWKLPIARQTLKQNSNWQKDVIPCLYRPLDMRYCLLSEAVMDYPRLNINRNMLFPNLSLVTTRQTKEPFAAVATDLVCGQHKIAAMYDGSYVFPLWLYPDENSLEAAQGRRANLAPAFVQTVAERVGEAPEPEQIFHYIYAILHAPTYRERYAPFLKIDFPRIPLPTNAAQFRALAALGKQLTELHLLTSPALTPPGIAFPVAGNHVVAKIKAAERWRKQPLTPQPPLPSEGERGSDAPADLPPLPSAVEGALGKQTGGEGGVGSVYLNETEHFTNIPREAFEYRVGGYQPASKWLEDRAGRTLTEDEIGHYRRILAALRETARLLPEIDAAYRNGG